MRVKIQGIYMWKNSIDGKVLIGSGKDCMTRKSRHLHDLRNNKHGNPHLQAAYNRDGESSFEFSICEIVEDESQLLIQEDNHISRFGSLDNSKGYNMKPASRPTHSEESKLRMSLACKGKPKSEEHRRKMSEMRKGKPASEETKLKLSQARKGRKQPWMRELALAMSERNKGRVHSEETKKKRSASLMGHKTSDETRRKISEANKGKPKCKTEETRMKMSAASKKRWEDPEIRRKILESRKKAREDLQ